MLSGGSELKDLGSKIEIETLNISTLGLIKDKDLISLALPRI